MDTQNTDYSVAELSNESMLRQIKTEGMPGMQ